MTLYFSGTAVYAIFLICRMFQDRECSKTDFLSWTIIALASLLWIVVLPISIMEIQNKAKHNISQKEELELRERNSPITDY